MENERDFKRVNRAKIIRAVIAAAVALAVIAASFFAGFFVKGCTQDSRLRSMEWLLETIEDNYYFYDDFDAEGAKDLSLYAVASKLDRYSEYYTKEEYQAQIRDNSGAKSGVGISYSFVSGKGILLNTVIGNSPASKSGLVAGDYLVGGERDGKEVAFVSAEAFSQYIDGFGTGEEFILKTESNSFTLSKQFYTASYAFFATADTSWSAVPSADGGVPLVEDRDGAIDFLPEGTGYLRVSQFYGTAAEEFGLLMKKFKSYNCTSLILDLRNNGGGYVSVMQDMAGYFVSAVKSETSVAMTAEYKNGKKEVYNCYKHSDGLVPAGTDIYVMANSGTASASEALIGVLISYGLLEYKNIFVSDYSAEFLGWAGEGAKTAQTYGKGIMQSTFVNYFTGEALKLTTARICWPNGKCIHDVALSEKDGCTPVAADWTVTRDDTELQRVVNLLG